jgi:hypothetical protein
LNFEDSLDQLPNDWDKNFSSENVISMHLFLKALYEMEETKIN